ncbi:MAG: nitrate reductase subunit beta [bacterium]|nr:nitrate reductase subunit beta [bacterium]
MNVRAQLAMVFHLDKCIGCHTCSVACKNIWTDRAGAEYMWWNNVETKPGTGYPSRWEDQLNFQGGWELTRNRELKLRSQGRIEALFKLFYNPRQPSLDDYYEPWTYEYSNLFDAPEGDDQPAVRAISQITGEPIDIKSGPNWDDDLSGSPIYAANDVNLDELTDGEREQLFEVERIAMMYLPRICNHCANPSCVAACPSGAIYKRGEDGIVLIDQNKCRGWRACVPACPYKKIYYNWQTGKSEKCILCFPRLETGQAPACFHSCVGRIRYLGVLLYDADRVPDALRVDDRMLIENHRNVLCDPFDETVIASAKENGISDEFLFAAQKSPVYDYVAKWKLALPLHAEYRTLPMLYYVPPLLPVMGKTDADSYQSTTSDLFSALDNARIPIKYLARLFGAGNVEPVEHALKKLLAVRYHQRQKQVGDVSELISRAMLKAAELTEREAEAIYRMTALPNFMERFVIPPLNREMSMEGTCSPEQCKGGCGFGPGQSLAGVNRD